ncbi:MAG: class I tRNA ligase family protein, partial [Alphaproteobacteria bacterium]|nr:class I tRNA ligase family protein [Alphaproteobacteria bacterium]
ECSAMSEAHLGVTFDIHGGGQDLIFPHHENEIAQSVCAHDGAPFVRTWMHNGYLTVDGEKMSKSLGNFHTVHDLLAEGIPGEAIRLALLSAHYRQPLDFSKQALAEAKGQLDRLYGALRGASREVLDHSRVTQIGESNAVLQSLMDDLNTPQAIRFLHALANSVHKAADDAERTGHQTVLRFNAYLLGLLQQDPEDWFKGDAADHGSLSNDEIDDMIRRRAEARKTKNFAEADRIRDALADAGVVLEDAAGGTTWKRSR